MSAVTRDELGGRQDVAIQELLDRLYAVISFEEGGEPDWRGLKALFSKHARITRVTPEGTDYMEPASFLDMTRNMLEVGAYTSFYEVEIERQIDRFGDIAQVWSLYETRRNKDARTALGRGVNSIQLVCEAGSWRVLGLLWDETHADPSLDLNKVFSRGASLG